MGGWGGVRGGEEGALLAASARRASEHRAEGLPRAMPALDHRGTGGPGPLIAGGRLTVRRVGGGGE